MPMEVWPKDDESSITLRLAPPLRLEADGAGMPMEVWLKEDETSDVTLRLVPLEPGHSERCQGQDEAEKGPPFKKPRKQGPLDPCRAESQDQGQSSKKQAKQGPAVATLHLHSAYLRRCQYFDACLAERWSNKNDLPLDLTLEARCNPRAYTRCMQLLYSQEVTPASFENVAHATEVLPVAAQLVFQECVDACMRYLADMPWGAVDLSAIRSAVSSFQIAPIPDLAARLGTVGSLARDSSLDSLKRVLETLLLKSMQLDLHSQTLEAKVLENRAACEKLLQLAMRGPTLCKSVTGVVKVAVYEALNRSVEDFRQRGRMYSNEEFSVAGKGLFWLLNTLVDFGMAEEAARTIFVDRSFSQMLFEMWPHLDTNSYSYSGLNFIQDSCNVLVRYLEIVAKGELRLENSVRLALVEAWLPELVAIDFCIFETTKKSVDKALNAVLKTLPPLEQEQYLSSWPTQNWPNLSEAFDAWCSTMCSNLAFFENDDQQPHA